MTSTTSAILCGVLGALFFRVLLDAFLAARTGWQKAGVVAGATVALFFINLALQALLP